jgi:hypothetical protein
MNRDIANTLEALANLLYLARVSLDSREQADAYLAMAEDIVNAAMANATRPDPAR